MDRRPYIITRIIFKLLLITFNALHGQALITTFIQTLVYQLSPLLDQEKGESKHGQNNPHTNPCLSTLINSHPCLTRSKESQNNSNTNSLSINSHPCLTRRKESENNSHANFCLSTLVFLYQLSSNLSKKEKL